MNRQRRKDIENVVTDLRDALDLLDGIKSRIEELRDEEQEYRDNMPDSIGDGEKGEQADAAIAKFDEVIDLIESLAEGEPCDMLNEAAE